MASSVTDPTITQKQKTFNDNLFPAYSDQAASWINDPQDAVLGEVASKISNPNNSFAQYLTKTFASPKTMDLLYSVFGNQTQSGPQYQASFEKNLIDNLLSQHAAANAKGQSTIPLGSNPIAALGNTSLSNQHDVGQTIADALTGTGVAANGTFYSDLQNNTTASQAYGYVDSLVKVLGAQSMSSDAMQDAENELGNMYYKFVGMEQAAGNDVGSLTGLDFANFLTYNAAAWLTRWFGNVQIGTPPPSPLANVKLPSTTGAGTSTANGAAKGIS